MSSHGNATLYSCCCRGSGPIATLQSTGPGSSDMTICSKDKHRVVHTSALVITRLTCLGVCRRPLMRYLIAQSFAFLSGCVLYLPVCLSVCLSVCLLDFVLVCLLSSVFCLLSICLSVWLSGCLFCCLFVCLVCPSVCLSVCSSVCLLADLSV